MSGSYRKRRNHLKEHTFGRDRHHKGTSYLNKVIRQRNKHGGGKKKPTHADV